MKKIGNMKKICIMILCTLILGSTILISAIHYFDQIKSYKKVTTEKYDVLSYNVNESQDVVYLSDIEYIASQSYAKYDKIRYDEVNGGGQITVKIENGAFAFKKGIWAHANSQVTYDISDYDYRYFTAFIGLNTTSAAGDGVRFYIFTSEDGKNWGEAKYEEVKRPKDEATHVEIELEDANYIRLIANQIGNNASDHSVYADAKLVNDITEGESVFKTVEEYDSLIKSQYNGQSDLTGEIEFNLLKRQLISNVGKFTINSFYNENDDNKEMLDWLMNNQKALKYYILGGKPAGNNYYKSLTEFSRLYRNYKKDFINTDVTKYGTVLGDLYLRMATSLSLTHAGVVGLWMNNASTPENQSDSVRRYAIIKYMHQNNLFEGPDGMDYNTWFENYTVEEMRYVMANNIDDQSMLWLNAYVRELIKKEGSARLWPHRYISYVWPNYANPVYYAEENKDYFNELFSVPDEEHEGQRIGLWDVVYTIPGGVDVPEYKLQIPRGTSDNKIYKVWMNMRNKFGTGAVCGGISKTGSNIRGVLGLPDAVVGQPGHAAHINYFQNSKGEGYWGIDNDVSGWAYTGSSGLLGWANGPYASGYTGTYIPLAQEVINHEDIYEQSQKFVYLADSYTDLVKKEEMYRKALEVQPLNLNAWYGLILTYNNSNNKTEEQYFELAKEIAEALKYYPLPMYQMTNQMKPKLTSQQESYKFTLLQTRILKEASSIPNNSTAVLQPSITKLMANFLLGQMDTTIATFSFDGEDAGKIALSSRFDGNGVRWDYSIDGKKTWKEVSFSAEESHKWQLTPEEIDSITSENDLYIHIVGVNYNEENLYKIDILESEGLPATLFANDLENKVLGAVDSVQWKYEETDAWKYYKDSVPELKGNKTLILRRGATGTHLASNTSTTYTFTEDVIDNKRKYIPVSHLSLHAFSTEAASHQGNALFALDGNYNTRWHSDWNGGDKERYITVKLDQPYNISAVEFVPAAGGNGKIYDGTIWGSMDGENWFILSEKKGLTYTNAATTVAQAIANIKSFDVDAPQKVQYVKIVADRTNGNWITARAFNFYEDTTIKNIASFSFDGTKAGMISLYDEFKNVNWKYSIDGGDTWQSGNENNHQLTQEEIEKIDNINMIKIKLDNDESEYMINIKKFDTPEKGYLNDFENRPINQPNIENLEWKISGEKEWHSYSDNEPNVVGNKTLLVRRKAAGISAASDPIQYEFTEDNQEDNETYIPIKHLSIHGFSTQSKDGNRPYYAPNAIDGNINTQWHTDFRIADKNAYIAIKLDEPRFISGIDYFHMDAEKESYGYMKNAIISVSEDGENWTEVASVQNLPQEDLFKHISFNNSVYGQYVKIAIESHDNIFATAAMINIYEDLTKITTNEPRVEITYSTTDLTNQDVVATLSSEDDIEITNNNGSKTHIFTVNGEFTFEYKDKANKKYSIKAIVTNIDKVVPTAEIEYSTTIITNGDITATLKPSEEVTITNNNGSDTYVFAENKEFTFEFVDKAGNTNSATATVDWIDKEAPTAIFEYNIKEATKDPVIATLKPSEEVTITNNNGLDTYTFTENGEFTFEFVDKAGNTGSATATVDWINKTNLVVSIEYSTKEPTKNPVIATLKSNEEITIINNDGKDTYTFTENGKFTFEFVDKDGNTNSATATVDWIDKENLFATIEYSTKEPTRESVIVTLKPNKEVVIINNNGKDTYTFTENGEFTFEFIDKVGNISSATATVDWIDKEPPTAELKYEKIGNIIVVRVINASEKIIFESGNGTYEFSKNGIYDIYFFDIVGNRGKVTAIINSFKDNLENDKNNGDNNISNGNINNSENINNQYNSSNGSINNNITDKNEVNSSNEITDNDNKELEDNSTSNDKKQDNNLKTEENSTKTESKNNRKKSNTANNILIIVILTIVMMIIIDSPFSRKK